MCMRLSESILENADIGLTAQAEYVIIIYKKIEAKHLFTSGTFYQKKGVLR